MMFEVLKKMEQSLSDGNGFGIVTKDNVFCWINFLKPDSLLLKSLVYQKPHSLWIDLNRFDLHQTHYSHNNLENNTVCCDWNEIYFDFTEYRDKVKEIVKEDKYLDILKDLNQVCIDFQYETEKSDFTTRLLSIVEQIRIWKEF